MRVAEIRNIVSEATNSSEQIELQSEPIYGGQAYVVSNYGQIIAALNLLKDQPWNGLDFAPIAAIHKKFRQGITSAQLSQADYNELNSYVASLNQKLPIYLGIVNALVEPQAEQAINIKLPGNLSSLQKLTNLNNRLGLIFKEFKIDGEVTFVGFDKGTDWYVLCLTGIETYHVFIGCLKVAQEFYKAKTEYYHSKTAELDYKAALKRSNQKPSDEGFEAYKQDRMELELEEKVRDVLEKVQDRNGHTAPELHSKVLKGTKELVEALGEDVEFHLSLNPPSYANETSGSLNIDYTSIKAINEAQQKEKNKQIEPSSDEEHPKDSKVG